MLELNIGMVVGWLTLMFCAGFVGAWLTDLHRKSRIDKGDALSSSGALLQSPSYGTTPQIRIGLIDAMNGRIFEVSTPVSHPGVSNHYDWKTEMYVVPEDQKLSEAIAVVMLMKGLEQ